jgi:hypothetical protein
MACSVPKNSPSSRQWTRYRCLWSCTFQLGTKCSRCGHCLVDIDQLDMTCMLSSNVHPQEEHRCSTPVDTRCMSCARSPVDTDPCCMCGTKFAQNWTCTCPARKKSMTRSDGRWQEPARTGHSSTLCSCCARHSAGSCHEHTPCKMNVRCCLGTFQRCI